MDLSKTLRNMDLDIFIIFQEDSLKVFLKKIRRSRDFKWTIHNSMWANSGKIKEVEKEF